MGSRGAGEQRSRGAERSPSGGFLGSELRREQRRIITRNSQLLTPNSSLLTPNSALLMPHAQKKLCGYP